MKSFRCERVADLITREIANILKTKVSDPRLHLITITATRVTRDLRMAHVFYSMLGQSDDPELIQKSFDRAKGFIRRELGNLLDLRYVPDLRFEFDQSLETGNRIWETLEAIGDETPTED